MAEDHLQPPSWAMPLIEEMRSYVREGREGRRQAEEDRRQAAEDRKVWQDRWESDRKKAAEDRRIWQVSLESNERQATEDRKEIARILEAIGKVGLRILKNQETQTGLLRVNNLLLRRSLSNGRFHGNGRRAHRAGRKAP